MQMQEIMQFVSAHPILSVAWIVLFVAVLVTTFKSRISGQSSPHHGLDVSRRRSQSRRTYSRYG